MAKRSAVARQPQGAADILELFRKELERNRYSIKELVVRVLERVTPTSEFARELLHLGLYTYVCDALEKEPRNEIMRRHALMVVSSSAAQPVRSISVVVRSELRDWPVAFTKGRTLENCTPDEVMRAGLHSIGSGKEAVRRGEMLVAAAEEARQRNCNMMGELPDEIMDKLLEPLKEDGNDAS